MCKNYVCLTKRTVNHDKSQIEVSGPNDAKNIFCSRNRKRKHMNDSFLEQGTLSLDNGDNNLLDTESAVAVDKMERPHSSLESCFVATEAELRTDVLKHAVVDYSSSSDEDVDCCIVRPASAENMSSEVVPSRSTVSETFTVKPGIDSRILGTVDDCREERSLLPAGKDERGIGKSISNGCDCDYTTLDRAMAVLRQLRCVVSRLVAKNMFPFNVQPLIRHLSRCEVLYSTGNKETP